MTSSSQHKYNLRINRLKGNYAMHFDNLQPADITQMIDIMKNEEGLSNSTIKGYLTAIQVHLKGKGIEDQDINKFILARIHDFNVVEKKHLEQNVLSDAQQQNYVKWNKIMEVRRRLATDIDTKKKHSNYALLSCYVFFPPRRVQDYAHMLILNSETDINDPNNNYYYRAQHKFIFNKYKTSGKYGQQVFKVPKRVGVILNEYIDTFDIQGSLFDMSETNIIRRLHGIFQRFLQKNISVNLLRHSFISYKRNLKQLETVKQKRTIAYKMGHSISLQDLYFKR